MYSLKTAAAIIGVIVFSGACSSGLEDNAKPLEPSAAFERVFSTYDIDGDDNVSSEELAKGVKPADEASVDSILNTYDMNGDKLIDKVEFTGLLKARVLVGLPKDSGWDN